jgi:hypothetical protein
MRLLKICSLLFSLGQFLLILKLIELVRGNPVSFNNQENELHPQLQQEEEERSFFLAPSKVKQKNYKRWGDGSNTTTENIITATDIDRLGIENDEEYYQFEPPSSELNSTSKSNNSIITKIQANTDSSGEERLCPVRFFFWTFCPLDIPFVRLLFSKELMDNYHTHKATKL